MNIAVNTLCRLGASAEDHDATPALFEPICWHLGVFKALSSVLNLVERIFTRRA